MGLESYIALSWVSFGHTMTDRNLLTGHDCHHLPLVLIFLMIYDTLFTDLLTP